MEDSAPIRINKALAIAGICSRRQAEVLIGAGRVAVNGLTVTELGHKIDPARDALTVDGKPVSLAPNAAPLTLVLHKKAGVVTTARDPEGRPTVFEGLPLPYRSRRLFSVGRLDYFSEGLLLLTTDGELAFRLAHPRWHVVKRYKVMVRGSLPPDALGRMEQGMRLAEGELLAPVRVRMAATVEPNRHVLEMELSQGVNRQIRRMCRDLGLTVLRLVRIAQGPIDLGNLPAGECRELTDRELRVLYAAVSLSTASTATSAGSADNAPKPSASAGSRRKASSGPAEKRGKRPPPKTRP